MTVAADNDVAGEAEAQADRAMDAILGALETLADEGVMMRTLADVVTLVALCHDDPPAAARAHVRAIMDILLAWGSPPVADRPRPGLEVYALPTHRTTVVLGGETVVAP